MKRAYPQYLAAGGEKLPPRAAEGAVPGRTTGRLIRSYSAEHQLDPYMVAALIAQESTFTADVKSAANAYGLMQLLPSTGAAVRAQSSELKRFSIEPADDGRRPNIKMGTALLRRSGAAVRRRASRARQLQRRRPNRVRALDRGAAGPRRATSSSTTSRSRKRRTT